MTVTANGTERTTACNGITTVFSVPFQVVESSDLLISLVDPITYDNEQLLSEGVDYTVSGNLISGNGQITTTTAYPAGRSLWRRRATAREQKQVYNPNDGFPAKSHEGVADKQMLIAQEQDGQLADTQLRSILLPKGEIGTVLPRASLRAGGNKILAPNPMTGAIGILDGSFFGGDPGGNAMAIGVFQAASGLRIEPGYDLIQTSGHIIKGLGHARYVYDPAVDADYVAQWLRSSFIDEDGRGYRIAEPVLMPSMFGAIGDGLTDDTDALAEAFAAATAWGLVLDLGFGVFKVTGSIVATRDLRCINSGGAVIRAAAGTYSQSGIINLIGSAAQIEDLGADVSRGAVTIASAVASSLAAGDLATIYNPTDKSWAGWRTYYRAGEFLEIANVSGTTINLQNPLYASYAAAAVDCYKVTPIRGYIKDIIIESDGYTNDLIYLDYGRDFRIINPTLRNKNNSCIYISRSVGTTVETPDCVNPGDGGDDYGIIVSGQHTRITGGKITARRHAVTTGGAARVNDFPCRNLWTTGATLRNDPASGVHCADFHGITDDCGYANCTIYGGISPQGRDTHYLDNIVYSMAGGIVAFANEIVGGLHEMRGNTFYILADPGTSTIGVIDFGGNNNTCIGASTIGDVDIVVDNNTFISTALGATASFLVVRNRGTAKKLNPEFTNNRLRVNAFTYCLFMDLISGTAASDSIVVDGNKCGLTGKTLMRNDGNYSPLPVLKMQKQTWTDVVTTSTSASFVQAPLRTLKWIYPRNPHPHLDRGDQAYLGSRLGGAYWTNLSTSQIRSGLGVDDAGVNFGAAAPVTLSGSVEIAD